MKKFRLISIVMIIVLLLGSFAAFHNEYAVSQKKALRMPGRTPVSGVLFTMDNIHLFHLEKYS
jgi:hypothetical protein